MTQALQLTPRQRTSWRLIQAIVWVLGAAIFLALIFRPQVGIHAFWNVLIPLAPAILVIVPGLWRNICPLATTGLLPRHLSQSKRKIVPVAWQVRLSYIGLAILFLVVPLRHVLLDTNGPATALTIGVLAIIALSIGTQVEWRSGWCASLCPVHQVEKLYGQKPVATFPNAHCTSCSHCVGPCPDSTKNFTGITLVQSRSQERLGLIMAGSFPGFVWGWFQVRDFSGGEGWSHLLPIYLWPLGGAVVTLLLFHLLDRALRGNHKTRLIQTFAAAAVSAYYWYRLPALFGFGPFPGDGMLIDLSNDLPQSFPFWSHLATTSLFAWWLIGQSITDRSWTNRPPRWTAG